MSRTVLHPPRQLEDVAMQARAYPAHLLEGHKTGLSLFSAGFHGWNDVIHFAQHGLDVTCVDIDTDRMWEMAKVYPERYEFRVEDVWEFSERAVHDGRIWDVVSVDPYLGDAAEHAWQTLYLWTSLAAHVITLTVAVDTHLNIPEGWRHSYMPRSATASWLILTR